MTGQGVTLLTSFFSTRYLNSLCILVPPRMFHEHEVKCKAKLGTQVRRCAQIDRDYSKPKLQIVIFAQLSVLVKNSIGVVSYCSSEGAKNVYPTSQES